MKATFTWMAGGAFLALTAVSAQADCAAELARLTEGGMASEGIAKDGSLAPLEGASDAAAGTDAAATDAADTAEAAGMNSAAPTDAASTNSAATGAASTDSAAAEGGEGISKDGSHVPLADASGQQAGVAMSGADAAAQQEGQPTAAEQATGAAGADHSAREAHIQAARDALAAGDEDACMKAVQAAQSS